MSDSDGREDPPTADTLDDGIPPTDTSLPETPKLDPDGPQETESPTIDSLLLADPVSPATLIEFAGGRTMTFSLIVFFAYSLFVAVLLGMKRSKE